MSLEPPLPQDPWVQAYFNHSRSAQYTDPYRGVTREGDNLEQVIVDAIASAKSTVDVAVQELRMPRIAQALVERQQAGVKVRVILDNNYSLPVSQLTAESVAKLRQRERSRYNESLILIDRDGDGQLSATEISEGDALIILGNGGVPMIDDTADGSRGSGLMHHKFIVIDNKVSIITSANFTLSDLHGDFQFRESRGNANNLLKIDSVELAKQFTQEFNLMWGDGAGGKPDSKFGLKKPSRPVEQVTLGDTTGGDTTGGDTTIAIQFSPTSTTKPWNQSSNGLIAQILPQARETIHIALFVFSEQRLTNVLEESHQQGVQLKALIEPSFAFRYYSEGLDMMGVAVAHKCQYESGNRPWRQPIATVGVPQLPEGDVLHHKFAILDGKTVITGSHNWSKAANTRNDETLLVIHSPMVAAHFEREFQRLYGKAVKGVPVRVQRKIKAQQQKCVPLDPHS
ncbi:MULTISPECIES: phospholipase D-like domain-containing protein [Moorena]|uniref:phospholipase D-like domain-containing protein n=1 Tax=Moorena TaxID=1155738 RepID=UPI00030FB99D|nr:MULTISPECIES: phospholipase D-like domain-containing protein [Moorena]